jgi:tetratricopeptide (TPR) repeat protein
MFRIATQIDLASVASIKRRIAMQDYFPDLMSRLARASVDAVPELIGAIAEHPHDARPWLLLAAEHAGAGRVDDAEAAYISALQLAPQFAIARFQLGLLQLSTARPAAARATWEPLRQLEQHDPLRLFAQGLEYLAEDNFEAAVHWLQQGIAHNTNNAILNHDMQKVLDRIKQLPNDADGSDAAEEASGAHFLVSAYGNR